MARQVIVEILGDAEKFDRATKQATGSAGRFGNVLKGIGAGIGFGVFNLATTAIGGVTHAITGAVESASKLEQSTGAIESVFGSAAKEIEAFGAVAAKTAGLSKNQVNEMGAVIGAQLQGMGFEASEAAKRTIDLQKRAADMAATFGGPTSQAVQAITALMRGERDPIEKYGVSLRDADIKARILALGLDTSTVAAQKNATAVASMDLLMEQTAKTAGQFGRESGLLAGQQQIAAAQLENSAAAIGEKLLPVMAAAASFVNEQLIPAFSLVIGVLGEVWTAIQPVVTAIISTLTPAFQAIVAFIRGTLAPAFKTTFGTIVGVVTGAVNAISPLIGGAISVIRGIATAITDVSGTVFGAINNIIGFIGGAPGRISAAASGMWNGIWNAFKSVINNIIRGWNGLKFSLPKVDLGPLGTFGGFSVGTPNIPYLHQGGIVPGVPGSDVLAMLQAGERVVPRGEGGQTIVINIDSFIGSDTDIDRFADKVALRLLAR